MLISRLTACAGVFAIAAAATIALAAGPALPLPVPESAAQAAPPVQLERVVVVARRLPAESR